LIAVISTRPRFYDDDNDDEIDSAVEAAILSQFSKTNNATTYSDEDSEDNAIISKLQEEDDDEEVDPDVDDDNDNGNDEIDSAVEASDKEMVDDVVRELEQDSFGEETLTREDISLGRFSLSKVCSLSLFNFLFLTCVNHSPPISERVFSTAQLFAPTSKPGASTSCN
jgi:hypothetical protein